MSNLLITGGLGYIGTSFIKQINHSKYSKIIIVDLDLFDTRASLFENLCDEIKNKIILKKINFSDNLMLTKIFNEFDINIVVHLGGLVGDPACAFDLKLTEKINTTATNNIIDLSCKNGIEKFVFASSCSVYGINEHICDENTDPKPISEYANSKLHGEKKLESVKHKFEEIIIFRFSTLYGVSERIRFDLVANLFYSKAKWENKITLFGGWQWRPFLHVKDAALSLCSALENSFKGFNVFNVGLDSGNSTLETLAKITQYNFPNCEIIEEGSGDDARNYKVNFSKFNNNFGKVLKFDLVSGINDLFNDLEFFKGDWTDSKYSNLLTTKQNIQLLFRNNV